jgi:ankyrin repeat protein
MLTLLALLGNLNLVKELIEQGVNHNLRSTDNRTLLMFAVESGNLDLVHFLVDHHHFEINAVDFRVTILVIHILLSSYCLQNLSSLSLAVIGNHFHIVKYLIDRGADTNISDNQVISGTFFHFLVSIICFSSFNDPQYTLLLKTEMLR